MAPPKRVRDTQEMPALDFTRDRLQNPDTSPPASKKNKTADLASKLLLPPPPPPAQGSKPASPNKPAQSSTSTDTSINSSTKKNYASVDFVNSLEQKMDERFESIANLLHNIIQTQNSQSSNSQQDTEEPLTHSTGLPATTPPPPPLNYSTLQPPTQPASLLYGQGPSSSTATTSSAHSLTFPPPMAGPSTSGYKINQGGPNCNYHFPTPQLPHPLQSVKPNTNTITVPNSEKP